MPDTITLTLDRATADDLLIRLGSTPHEDGDEYECYLIALLADALGEPVTEWMRKRAERFAA